MDEALTKEVAEEVEGARKDVALAEQPEVLKPISQPSGSMKNTQYYSPVVSLAKESKANSQGFWPLFLLNLVGKRVTKTSGTRVNNSGKARNLLLLYVTTSPWEMLPVLCQDLLVGGRLIAIDCSWMMWPMDNLVKSVLAKGYKIPFSQLRRFNGVRQTPLMGQYAHVLLEEA